MCVYVFFLLIFFPFAHAISHFPFFSHIFTFYTYIYILFYITPRQQTFLRISLISHNIFTDRTTLFFFSFSFILSLLFISCRSCSKSTPAVKRPTTRDVFRLFPPPTLPLNALAGRHFDLFPGKA